MRRFWIFYDASRRLVDRPLNRRETPSAGREFRSSRRLSVFPPLPYFSADVEEWPATHSQRPAVLIQVLTL